MQHGPETLQNRTMKIKDATAQGARRGILQSQLLEERGLSTVLALHGSMRLLRERKSATNKGRAREHAALVLKVYISHPPKGFTYSSGEEDWN